MQQDRKNRWHGRLNRKENSVSQMQQGFCRLACIPRVALQTELSPSVVFEETGIGGHHYLGKIRASRIRLLPGC